MRHHYRIAVRSAVSQPRLAQHHLRNAARAAALAVPYCHVRATMEGEQKRVLEILIEDEANGERTKRITARA